MHQLDVFVVSHSWEISLYLAQASRLCVDCGVGYFLNNTPNRCTHSNHNSRSNRSTRLDGPTVVESWQAKTKTRFLTLVADFQPLSYCCPLSGLLPSNLVPQPTPERQGWLGLF